jgi:hypothetical protein
MLSVLGYTTFARGVMTSADFDVQVVPCHEFGTPAWVPAFAGTTAS